MAYADPGRAVAAWRIVRVVHGYLGDVPSDLAGGVVSHPVRQVLRFRSGTSRIVATFRWGIGQREPG